MNGWNIYNKLNCIFKFIARCHFTKNSTSTRTTFANMPEELVMLVVTDCWPTVAGILTHHSLLKSFFYFFMLPSWKLTYLCYCIVVYSFLSTTLKTNVYMICTSKTLNLLLFRCHLHSQVHASKTGRWKNVQNS